MDLLKSEFGVTVKSHSSSVESHVAKKLTAFVKEGKSSTGIGSSSSSSDAGSSPTTTPHLRVALIKKKDVKPSQTLLKKKPAEEELAEESASKASEDVVAEETQTAIEETTEEIVAEEPVVEEEINAPEPEVEEAAEEIAETESAPQAEEEAAAEPEVEETTEEIAETENTPQKEEEAAPSEPKTTEPAVEAPKTTPTPETLTPKRPTRGRVQSSISDQPGIKIIKPAPVQKEIPVIKRAKPPEKKAPDGSPADSQPRGGADERNKNKFNTIPPHLRRVGPKLRKDENNEKNLPKPKARQKQKKTIEEEAVTEITLEGQLSVRELADMLKRPDTDIIKHVFMKGVMVTVNQTLDLDFAKTIAEEMEVTVHIAQKEEKSYDATDALNQGTLDDKEFKNLEERAPVISIMGHVDHGKTSLLDAIRQTRHQIVDTEAGGITQSIGAYSVNHNGQRVVFLDTPGHEAFTAMRMRGAQATDVAILVVAADDGVMPQTLEAINHAKAANIPIIVAVNKMDKENADPDKVLGQLAEHDLLTEDWGGDHLVARVSAIKGTGLDELLDHILLLAELKELKADATVAATGVVVEAKLDKRRGPLVTALVQNGTLRTGDNILIGSVSGRVRALIDDNGKTIQEAGPSTPVEILGLSNVPQAGDNLEAFKNNQEFKKRVQQAEQQAQADNLETRQIMPGLKNPEDVDKQLESTLHFIVKADTQGSAEAVNESIQTLSNEEVKIKILHSGTGNITEADVMLASASRATIIGFNVGQDGTVIQAAQREDVSIRSYDVIYHLTEDVEKMVVGELSPEIIEVETGRAEVREIFHINKQIIAGCMATEGKLVKPSTVTVERNGEQIHRGPVASLKRFKDDVKEVAQGFECGIKVEGIRQLEAGDVLIFQISEEKQRTLDSVKKSASATSA